MNRNIEVIPLGTISPYCKNTMNCPGFLIKYHNYNILLDCGNGITRYMNFPNDLNNLNVFISHIHEDHYGDLSSIMFASLIYKNHKDKDKYTKVYLPNNNLNIEERFNTLKYKINNDTKYSFDDLIISFKDNNSHDIESYMMKLENANNKVVYTGDIGLSNIDGIIDFSNNSDLLICESSFITREDESIKTHFNAKDAAIVAKEAKVKKLLITHFWPEYDKNEYLKEAKKYFESTEVAIECKKLIMR